MHYNMERKYYQVNYCKKSHSDYPSPWFSAEFSSDNEEEYNEKLQSYIKGCEDYDVKEISKHKFISNIERYDFV